MSTTCDTSLDRLVQSLRAAADFLQQHPGLGVRKSELDISFYSFGEPETLDLAKRIAKELGTFRKEESDTLLVLTKNLGVVKLRFVFGRENICLREQVGTRTIPAAPARPASKVPVYKYHCPPLLTPATPSTTGPSVPVQPAEPSGESS